MEFIEGGSVLTPNGFRVGSSSCGLKRSEGADDIAILTGDSELSGAGVFTRNAFAAAPVLWCRSVLPTDSLRAIVVNSGNANACTGAQGMENAGRMAKIAAELSGCKAEQVAVASTGIIGRPLPMDRVTEGIKEAYATLASENTAARKAEKAILTTDTRPKSCAARLECTGGSVSIGAMAKGSGMIAPDMATMLAFITTDISAGARALKDILSYCAGETFNRISVDGDTSTNDSVFLAASGKSGISLEDPGVRDKFIDAIYRITRELAMQIVADGEGATRVIRVHACGCGNKAEAVKVARAISNSSLVKCAAYGADPNWGRIVCAAGYSGAKFDPEDVDLFLGKVRVVQKGLPTGYDASEEMQKERIEIKICLGAGDGQATFWTCDMSERYVQINAS